MHADLLKLFSQITELNEEEKSLITASFKPFYLKKGGFFLEAGEVNKHIAFLQKGLVRYFVFKNDEESTFEFTREGEFVGDYQSFTGNTPSVQNIQAIEDCEMLVISNKDVQHIFNSTLHGNLLGRHIIEHRFDVMVNQLLAVYMQNHEDRYKRFMEYYADLAQRIPQYLIASYCGIKPQSLSRIRNRWAKNIS